MNTLLTESDLLAAMPATRLADIRAKAPPGEDPVVVVMMQACATVDGSISTRAVPPAMASRLARDLAVFDLAKILDKPTDAQKTAYDHARADLEDIRKGAFPQVSEGGVMSWGSQRQI